MTFPDGDMRRTEARLIKASRGKKNRYFCDFAPTNFFAEQGLLVRL